jgi:hypothetical protein
VEGSLFSQARLVSENDTATASCDDPLLGRTVGAQMIVRVTARAIFPNCPRYIPKLQLTEPSVYAPRPGYELSEPAWMGFDAFKDVIYPRSRPGRGAKVGWLERCRLGKSDERKSSTSDETTWTTPPSSVAFSLRRSP